MKDEFRATEIKYNNPFYLSNNYSSSNINITQYKQLCAELEICLPKMMNFKRKIFVLEHPDLNEANIFVSPDFAICCIIDWEYASTVPWEAFCIHPHLPGRRDPLQAQLRNVFEDTICDLERLDDTVPRVLCSSSGELVPSEKVGGMTFSELLSRPKPMWAYDRLVQNEAWIEFHPIVDEFLSWKLGPEWRAKFRNKSVATLL